MKAAACFRISPRFFQLIAGALPVGAAATALMALLPAAAHAQIPSALYTWDDSGFGASDVEGWGLNNFPPGTSATFQVLNPGELTIVETNATPGTDIVFSDHPNR